MSVLFNNYNFKWLKIYQKVNIDKVISSKNDLKRN